MELLHPLSFAFSAKNFTVFWQLFHDGTPHSLLNKSAESTLVGFFCSCPVALPLDSLAAAAHVFMTFFSLFDFLLHVPPLVPSLSSFYVSHRRTSKLMIILLASYIRSSIILYAESEICNPLLEVCSSFAFYYLEKTPLHPIPAQFHRYLVGLQLALATCWRALLALSLYTPFIKSVI
jgi:ABC-type nitrate/sulfonate/bicarbonate transport system permease component